MEFQRPPPHLPVAGPPDQRNSVRRHSPQSPERSRRFPPVAEQPEQRRTAARHPCRRSAGANQPLQQLRETALPLYDDLFKIVLAGRPVRPAPNMRLETKYFIFL